MHRICSLSMNVYKKVKPMQQWRKFQFIRRHCSRVTHNAVYCYHLLDTGTGTMTINWLEESTFNSTDNKFSPPDKYLKGKVIL